MKIIFSISLLFVLFSCKNSDKKVRVLPMVGNFDIVYSMVNGKEVADTVYPKMVDFSYLNQDSILIKSSDMKGKIWIADFMFTSCPTICPKMTEQMNVLNLNNAFKQTLKYVCLCVCVCPHNFLKIIPLKLCCTAGKIMYSVIGHTVFVCDSH